MARLSPFVPFGLVLAFQAWLWPFWPVFGLSDTLYNLTICEKRCRLCSAIELSTCFTRDFAETVLFGIYKRRNCNLRSKSSFTKVKLIIPEKITIAIQYRHKKRCTANCQDHREMKPLLKQKLKDRLQRTRQSARNKESRTLGFEAIGKLCRHGRIIYYSSK